MEIPVTYSTIISCGICILHIELKMQCLVWTFNTSYINLSSRQTMEVNPRTVRLSVSKTICTRMCQHRWYVVTQFRVVRRLC